LPTDEETTLAFSGLEAPPLGTPNCDVFVTGKVAAPAAPGPAAAGVSAAFAAPDGGIVVSRD
jgi:hypothetical protein